MSIQVDLVELESARKQGVEKSEELKKLDVLICNVVTIDAVFSFKGIVQFVFVVLNLVGVVLPAINYSDNCSTTTAQSSAFSVACPFYELTNTSSATKKLWSLQN